jgi:hypothetical protein
MRGFLPILLTLTAPLSCIQAVQTGTWRQSTFDDFQKGVIDKLSLRSDGRLSLAPVFPQILDSSLPYFWALAEDSKGNVYAGGGGPGGPGARVYVIAPDGRSRVAAELDSMEVHALAVDRQDRIYAATSPDGKVYRFSDGGKPEVFYDPAAKYVWALALDAAGNLFVATGDQGLIHRVAPDGKGAVFFRTEETHARSLAVDSRGNLIVGTEPRGLILRVTPSGEGFVLYQTSKREITAVAVRADGSVFAAGVGNRQPAVAPAAPAPGQPAPSPAPLAATVTLSTTAVQVVQVAAPPPPTLTPQPVAIAGGSEVYRIEADGYPRRIWTHPEAVAYAIAFDTDGHPLIGTGNRGSVYRLDSDVLSTALVSATTTQITSLAAGRGGRIYAATGNIGRIYRIGPELERQGSLESDVFDSESFTLWGRLVFRGDAGGGAIRFTSRSGNLDRPRSGWSPWAPLKAEGDGGRVVSPQARFLQWKLTIEASAAGRSPTVDSVFAAYRPRNAAPVVEAVESTPANYRFPAQSLSINPSRNITLQPLPRPRRAAPATVAVVSGALTMQYEKGQLAVRWAAGDENGDTMEYKVELRGAGETEWKLLKDKIKDKHVGWDSTAYADGEYVSRVTATDAPDNPPGQELTGRLVSAPFLIDNTAPQISGLSSARSAGKVEIRWKVRDASSFIQSAEYSVDGGAWLVALPTTRISDSAEHDYLLALEGIAAGEHTIAVRVSDDYDNQSVANIVVR